MIDLSQKSLRDVDWLLLCAPIALTIFGCTAIYSAAPRDEATKQVIALGIGIVLAVVVMLTDYRKILINIAPFFYAAVIVLLVLVLFFGKTVHGNTAWLHIPGLPSIQPSEFAKVAVILMLARHMAQPRKGPLSIKDMIIMAAIA